MKAACDEKFAEKEKKRRNEREKDGKMDVLAGKDMHIVIIWKKYGMQE